MKLVIKHGDEFATTSEIIAQNTDNEHASVIKLIRDYVGHLEQFGGVRFEIATLKTKGGNQQREIAILNEQQSTFLLTLMRNTEIVVRFKVELVKEFYRMRNDGRISSRSMHVNKATSDLAPLRQQRAISLAIDNGDKIKARLPLLGEMAMQSIYAGLVNTAAGAAILPRAILEEKHKSATEIGLILGVHRNTVGKIANQNGMKTDEYGHYELGEAEFNSSQRETFVYNAKALARFRELLSANDSQNESAA